MDNRRKGIEEHKRGVREKFSARSEEVSQESAREREQQPLTGDRPAASAKNDLNMK